MSLLQILIYLTFSAIQLTDLLILHTVILFLVLLVYDIINYNTIYDIITYICLFIYLCKT